MFRRSCELQACLWLFPADLGPPIGAPGRSGAFCFSFSLFWRKSARRSGHFRQGVKRRRAPNEAYWSPQTYLRSLEVLACEPLLPPCFALRAGHTLDTWRPKGQHRGLGADGMGPMPPNKSPGGPHQGRRSTGLPGGGPEGPAKGPHRGRGAHGVAGRVAAGRSMGAKPEGTLDARSAFAAICRDCK